MTAANFEAALEFVWHPDHDSPLQGPHVTAHDPGGLTSGGITEATWNNAIRTGVVRGTSLREATTDQLETILRIKYWSTDCDNLPDGLDLLLFNGRMMTGMFPRLFQQALGMMGPEVDGFVGLRSLQLARTRDRATFIDAVSGAHHAYLSRLDIWREFGNGWTRRIKAARVAAMALAYPAPLVA